RQARRRHAVHAARGATRSRGALRPPLAADTAFQSIPDAIGRVAVVGSGRRCRRRASLAAGACARRADLEVLRTRTRAAARPLGSGSFPAGSLMTRVHDPFPIILGTSSLDGKGLEPKE